MNDKKRKSKWKSKKGKKYRKNNKRRTKIVQVPQKFDGFSPFMRTRLRYVEHYKLSSGVSPATQIMRLNSIWDPDQTYTSGHQPMWYDNYSLIYNRYIVLKTYVNIKCCAPNVNDFIVGSIRATNEFGAPTNLFLECERTGGRLFYMTPYQLYSKSSTYDVSKVLGIKPKEYAEDEAYRTLVNTNPTSANTAYLNIAVQNVDLSTTIVVYLDITMEFDVMFYDLIQNQPQN